MPLGIPPPSIGLTSGSPTEILLGTGTSVPPGLESIMEFNGVYLNDRSLIDTYLINQISGLEDADLRDDRDVNPQAHGETPFDAFYGGRTITLTGYIRAFTLDKLRDMQQGLKQAFAGLTGEKALIFHSFGDPTTDSMIYCRKGAPLQMAEVQPIDGYFRRDFMLTLRASNPRFLSLLQKQARVSLGVVDTFTTDSSASYDQSGAAYTVSGGKLVPPSTGLVAWTRNDLEFDLSDAEVVVGYAPNGGTFTGSNVLPVVRRLSAGNFIWGGITSTGALIIGKQDGGVDSTLSTGPTVPARSTANSYWVRTRIVGNVVTVEHSASDPRISSTGITSHSYTLAGANAIKFGSGIEGDAGLYLSAGSTAWRFDDLSITPYSINSSIIEVPNLGNFGAQPQIIFSGPMTNPILTNVLSGHSLSIEDSIVSNNPYTVDIANRLMTDAAGVNRFSKLAFDSEWLELEPGNNELILSASGISPVFSAGVWYLPEISVIYRDAWI